MLFAHIHLAPRGVNGPIVLPLAGAQVGAVNGVLAAGTVTAVELTGPLAGQTLRDLVTAPPVLAPLVGVILARCTGL